MDFGADVERLLGIATVLDRLPGAEGRGLKPEERARLFAFLEHTDVERWRAARTIHLTRTTTLWVAMMRHGNLRLHAVPVAGPVMVLLAMVARDPSSI
ncbi:MAG: hypothetical protein CMH36_01130 [Microbacterium sp.]|uniref:hypothetical protein n=1 Tax=Microbacterium sp. 4NA327F11 TaxID=2502229 RepID=UPI000C8A789D|nr:hypothetical protein [Microbacterium sp. 4NA327F11]MAL05451.1 hypothetical protein [Microbacterium sp.]MCK9913788.1 hypothetical protein [Microbacteriaceae bacterium K1510]